MSAQDPERLSRDSHISDTELRMRGRIRRASGGFDFSALLSGVHAQSEAEPARAEKKPQSRLPAVGPPMTAVAAAGSALPRPDIRYRARFQSRSRDAAWSENWRQIRRLGFCLWFIAVVFGIGLAGALVIEETTAFRLVSISRVGSHAGATGPGTGRAWPYQRSATHSPSARRHGPQRTLSPQPSEAMQEQIPFYFSRLLVALTACWLVWALWTPDAVSFSSKAIHALLIATCFACAVASGAVTGMVTMEHYRYRISVDLQDYYKRHSVTGPNKGPVAPNSGRPRY